MQSKPQVSCPHEAKLTNHSNGATALRQNSKPHPSLHRVSPFIACRGRKQRRPPARTHTSESPHATRTASESSPRAAASHPSPRVRVVRVARAIVLPAFGAHAASDAPIRVSVQPPRLARARAPHSLCRRPPEPHAHAASPVRRRLVYFSSGIISAAVVAAAMDGGGGGKRRRRHSPHH